MSNIHSTINIKLQETLAADLERKELYFNHSLSTIALFGLVVLPLIPGSLSFASIVTHFPDLLGIPTWLAYSIATFTAVGVEVLGLTVIKMALRMRKYNQQAATWSLDPAPIGQGWAAACLYLFVVLALVVLLKVMPSLSIWALIPLACLGAIADWAFALQGDQSEREAELRRRQAQEEAQRNQDSTIERLTTDLADRDNMVKLLQSTVNEAEQQIALVTTQFDTERQALNTQIIKLNAQVDTLRTLNSAQVPVFNTVQTVHDPELNTEHDTKVVTLEDGRNKANEQKRVQKAQRQSELLHILFTELNGSPSDDLNKSALAERLNTTRVTIGRDIDELINAQRLSINGHIEVL